MFDKQKLQRSSEPETESFGSYQTTPAANVTPAPAPRTGAVIGSTITIKGNISGEENLLIEGEVEGTVDLKGKDLTIGEAGRVRANVTAKVIKIEGEVHGDMSGKEKVVISKTGKVHGNITAPRVTLEDGAKFKGKIDMDPTEKTTAEPSLKSVKAPEKVQGVVEDPMKNGPTVGAKERA